MFLESYTTTMIGAIGALLILILVIYLLLWIIFPFSIFGIKGLIRDAIQEQKKTNELIRILIQKYNIKASAKEKEPEEKG